MNKHTPGEWTTTEDTCNSISIEGNNELIAELVNHAGNYIPDGMQANAKLIAAAPELLKELQNLVNCWDNDTFQDVDIEYAKQAIRKATEL